MRELNVNEIEVVKGGFLASAAWIAYGAYRAYKAYKLVRTISHAGAAGAIVGGIKEANGE
ncbi:MAG: hypothetical protein CL811_06070 [Colwelliaceae bacterium]|nr:hypothetical protein [Colwelliaceae bacterium]|tara:strand:- start:308 stop:487 length:180 start_codon:yes stop_codon:yes gene_type:complete